MEEPVRSTAEPVPGEPVLGTPAQFAGLMVAGTLLAAFVVWFGWAWKDGFSSGGAQVLAKQFLRQGWWRLPAAAVLGGLLHWHWSRLLAPGRNETKAGPILLSVIRTFTHFPLYGMLALLGAMFGFAALMFRGLYRRLKGIPAPPEAQDSNPAVVWLGIPVWFILLPLLFLELPSEGDMTLPVTVRRAALLRWLPWVLACLLMWTGMVSEDTGEPVDPYWLATFAAYWVGDYLIVANHVGPILRFRRGLAP